RRARRHEGRRGGTRLLHRARRHVGLRPRWDTPRDPPHHGGAGPSPLQRAGSPDALLHRPHVRVRDAREGARAVAPVVWEEVSRGDTTMARGMWGPALVLAVVTAAVGAEA